MKTKTEVRSPLVTDDGIIEIDLNGLAFSIRVHAGIDRYISSDIRRNGVWEPFETKVFRAVCAAGANIVDVGANIGWYSLVASSCVGVTGQVIALEPEPRNFGLLKENLRRNNANNVLPFLLAAGACSSRRQLYLSAENMGDHRLFQGDEMREAQEVEIRTLSELIATNGRKPNVIKSDTQGSEWDVVQGLSSSAFDPPSCCWLIEFWPHGLAGMDASPQQLLDWFVGYDYAFFELSEANPRLIATTRDSLLHRASSDLSSDTGHFINLLLMHPDDVRTQSIDPFLN